MASSHPSIVHLAPYIGKGRPKGARNKINRDVRIMLERSLRKAGGEKYLLECALSKSDRIRVAYLSLIAKLVPSNVQVQGDFSLSAFVASLQAKLDGSPLPPPPGGAPQVGGGVAALGVGSSRVDLQACKLEYSIVSPK